MTQEFSLEIVPVICLVWSCPIFCGLF